MPPTLIVDDCARLVKTFVELVEQTATAAVASRSQFAMAVTGGREGRLFLPALVDAQLDWRRAHIFFGDERAVDPSDPESNYRQLKTAWFDHATIPTDCIHRMPAEVPDLEIAAREYEATLVDCLGASPALDLFVIGMGPDGHVCSLFPGHPAAAERERLVAAVHDAPKPPPRRLTLTMPMIERAREVIVLATTAEKRGALDAALGGSRLSLPIAHVLHAAGRVVVLATAEV